MDATPIVEPAYRSATFDRPSGDDPPASLSGGRTVSCSVDGQHSLKADAYALTLIYEVLGGQ
jgi:hypothetical protein